MADIDKINELIACKKFEEAKPLLEEALKETLDDKEICKLAGLAYVNMENWNEAKKNFETVVKFASEDATSWFYLAKCYENLGDLISAKNAYIKVIQLRPEYMDAYKNLCVLLIKNSDISEVVKYAELARKIDSEDYLYDFIIGTAYLKNKEFEKALVALLLAKEKSPKNLGVINSLGTCYMATNKIPEAIEIYEKALEINPESPMTYFNIGSAYQILQKHELAIEYFRKALNLEEDESFLVALAMSEVKIGDYGSALVHYKQLALLCPSKENYKYNIVTCYEALGENETAIKMLEEIVFVNPKFILPAQKLASLYIKTNQFVKAKEIYDKILLKNNITPEVMHQYAVLSSSLCDSDTAEKMLKKAIRMNPEFAKAHKDLGIIYLNKRLFDYAEEEFKCALELAPQDFEIVFEYGNYLYSVSKNKEAEVYYQKALEIDSENVLALTFMALNKLVLKELDEARRYIMEAIKIEHHHEYVLFCAGRILYAREEYEEAKNFLIRAVEQNPDIETLNTLALTYFKLGEYQSALNLFKNIDSKRPKNISVLMEMARCYEALNDNDSALSVLDQVTRIFPDYEDAHEMIRKLS